LFCRQCIASLSLSWRFFVDSLAIHWRIVDTFGVKESPQLGARQRFNRGSNRI
jgi:hypothetical protein